MLNPSTHYGIITCGHWLSVPIGDLAILLESWAPENCNCGLATIAVTLLFLLKPFLIIGVALFSLLGYATITVVLLSRSRVLTGCGPIDVLNPILREVALVRETMHIRDQIGVPASCSVNKFPVTNA